MAEKTKEYEKLLSDWNKATADHEAWSKTKKEAEEEVKKHKDRFNEWYYVVDNGSYEKMKVKFEDLVKVKEEKPEEKKDVPAPNFQLPQFPK